jgi:hypothetical protein
MIAMFRATLALVCMIALTVPPTIVWAQERDATPALRKALEQIAVSPMQERLPKLLKELVDAKKSDEQIIEALYLAALTRLPTDKEATQAKQQAADSKERLPALDKLLKGLMESAEFKRLHPVANPLKAIPLERLPLEKRDPNAPGRGPFFDRP